METTTKRTSHRNTNGFTDPTVTRVYRTRDHAQFGYFEGNRAVIEAHVRNLMESLSERQIPSPIIVDELYRVADGQNRLEACKRLDLPVYYIIVSGLTLEDVKRMNSNTKAWSWQENMQSFIDLGVKDYATYKEFYESYELNHTECMQLLIGHTSLREGSKKGKKTMAKTFADGQFVILQHGKAIRQANMITKVKPYFESFTHGHFVRALVHLFNKKQEVFSFSKFLKKLAKRTTKLEHHTTRNGYLGNIEAIYNHGSRNKVRLFTHAD